MEKDPDDFVFWRYYLDIVPQKGIEQEKYISEVSRLVEELKQSNIRAVASCDFPC